MEKKKWLSKTLAGFLKLSFFKFFFEFLGEFLEASEMCTSCIDSSLPGRTKDSGPTFTKIEVIIAAFSKPSIEAAALFCPMRVG